MKPLTAVTRCVALNLLSLTAMASAFRYSALLFSSGDRSFAGTTDKASTEHHVISTLYLGSMP